MIIFAFALANVPAILSAILVVSKLALTEAIHFFFFVLKIFNAINAGAELGLATPLTTAISVTFPLDEKCIYSVAELLYKHIKPETIQMCAST